MLLVASGLGSRLPLDYEYPDLEEKILVGGNSYFKE